LQNASQGNLPKASWVRRQRERGTPFKTKRKKTNNCDVIARKKRDNFKGQPKKGSVKGLFAEREGGELSGVPSLSKNGRWFPPLRAKGAEQDSQGGGGGTYKKKQ